MLDWEIRDDEELPPLPTPTRPRRRFPTRRLALAALIVFVVMLAGVLLRWRENNNARLDQLRAFITSEEQARRFGHVDRARDFADPQRSDAWYISYRRSFVHAESLPPVDLALGTVDWDNNGGAVAEIMLGKTPTLRAYVRRGDSWRRTELPTTAWGLSMSQTVADDLSLHYFERDRAFAETLAERLPTLLTEVGEWGAPTDGPLRIEIEPIEFAPAIRDQEESQIRLNSPLLVGETGAWRADELLYKALADELFGRVSIAVPLNSSLPGGDRLVESLQQVAALRWALDADTLAIRRSDWQRLAADETMLSPLFGGVYPTELDSVTPTPNDAATLRLADRLYTEAGPEKIAAMVRAMEDATSWQTLFERTLGISLQSLDDQPPAAITSPNVAGHAVQTDLSTNMRLIVGDRSVLVRTSDTQLTNSDGTPVPIECLPLFGDLTVTDGEWIDEGYRLHANAITIEDWSPNVPTAPPPSRGPILLRSSTILTLDSDGSATTLATLPPMTWPMLPRGAPVGSGDLIMVRVATNCAYVGVTQLKIDEGEAYSWLLSPNWSPDEIMPYHDPDGLMLVQANNDDSNRWQTRLLRPGERGPIEPDGPLLPALTYPLGRTADSRWLLFAPSSLGDNVELYDPAQPNVRSWVTSVPSVRVSSFMFDGQRLYYLTPQVFDNTRGATLNTIDPIERTHVSGTWLAPEFMLWVAGAAPEQGALLVNYGESGNAERRIVQLLYVDPADRTSIYRTERQSEGSSITNAVACGRDSFYYMVQTSNEQQLYHWAPLSDTERLVWSGGIAEELWLVGCAG